MEIIIASIIAALASVYGILIKAKMDKAPRPCKLAAHTVQNEDVYKALEYAQIGRAHV